MGRSLGFLGISPFEGRRVFVTVVFTQRCVMSIDRRIKIFPTPGGTANYVFPGIAVTNREESRVVMNSTF